MERRNINVRHKSRNIIYTRSDNKPRQTDRRTDRLIYNSNATKTDMHTDKHPAPTPLHPSPPLLTPFARRPISSGGQRQPASRSPAGQHRTHVLGISPANLSDRSTVGRAGICGDYSGKIATATIARPPSSSFVTVVGVRSLRRAAAAASTRLMPPPGQIPAITGRVLHS